jgi:dimethylargininase
LAAAPVACVAVDERIALIRRPSRRMAEGIVTYGDRAPVDATLAVEQHAAYVAAISDAGWGIRKVRHADELPDSAFVEDTVVVCGDVAVLTRPGAVERRAELEGTEEVVRTLGLDVARLGRRVALQGFTVVPVALDLVLHLKSAVTALPDGTFVATNPSLLDTSPLPTVRRVPEEAGSHVVVLGEGTLLMAASAPRSAELFENSGFDVIAVDISEFEKMEGCVTCLSVLVQGT